ncbi:MAG: zinc transporter ZupT [Bacteroidetes bacterium]|uniref:Zinc transporter ZupT n=1 Tax=Candidatus Cryptobacteroides merdavium TaxID=2840769 RepID=A0A9D9EDD9_9BACT|nr:zinc transporter ZupT [Candidatus Cryptobacteroides merdavium]
MDGISHALLLTLLAGAATGVGGALILFRKRLSSNFLAAALGLSAGVMIFISLAELYPEAQAAMAQSGAMAKGKAWVLLSFFAGMGIITLIDFLVPEYENPHEASGLTLNTRTAATRMIHASEGSGDANALKKLGVMSALAIAIHNFPEGMATFIGALNDSQMGAGITFAIAIHNIPEGIAVAIPIYYATKSKGKALLYATISGLTEPVGAAICYAVTAIFGVRIADGGAAFPLILAAVAGIMIYISLDELLPTAEKYGKHHVAIAGVVAGMAIMGVSLLLM